MHSAFSVDLLVGAHRFARAHDIMNRGHAPLKALVEREDDAVFQLKIIKFRRDFLENQLRSLVELSRGLAGLRIFMDMLRRPDQEYRA